MSVLHGELEMYFDRQIASGKLRQLYLLTGEEGIGKRTFAGKISKKILCSTGGPIKPCGKCLSCRTFDAGTNADFIFIDPDNRNILIEESRAVIEALNLKPMVSARKAVLIADSHKLTVQAQNSLLKTIEEPPGDSVIILTCTDKELLLETIVSRAFHCSLKPQDPDDIRGVLGTVSEYAAKYGKGNIGRTKECMSPEFENMRKRSFEMLGPVILDTAADIREQDHADDLENELTVLLSFLRDILVIKAGSENIINTDMRYPLEEMAGKADRDKVRRAADRVRDAFESFGMNVSKRIIFGSFVYGS